MKEVFELKAKASGMTWEQFQEYLASTTHPRRVMTLEEVANMAVFMASDKASGMTGTTVNLTMGSLDDERHDRGNKAHTGKGIVLLLSCAAQFMVVLDIAIVNVALPSIQQDLGIGQSTLQWIVIAYGLMLGGFLLLGGRMADLSGAAACC